MASIVWICIVLIGSLTIRKSQERGLYNPGTNQNPYEFNGNGPIFNGNGPIYGGYPNQRVPLPPPPPNYQQLNKVPVVPPNGLCDQCPCSPVLPPPALPLGRSLPLPPVGCPSPENTKGPNQALVYQQFGQYGYSIGGPPLPPPPPPPSSSFDAKGLAASKPKLPPPRPAVPTPPPPIWPPPLNCKSPVNNQNNFGSGGGMQLPQYQQPLPQQNYQGTGSLPYQQPLPQQNYQSLGYDQYSQGNPPQPFGNEYGLQSRPPIEASFRVFAGVDDDEQPSPQIVSPTFDPLNTISTSPSPPNGISPSTVGGTPSPSTLQPSNGSSTTGQTAGSTPEQATPSPLPAQNSQSGVPAETTQSPSSFTTSSVIEPQPSSGGYAPGGMPSQAPPPYSGGYGLVMPLQSQAVPRMIQPLYTPPAYGPAVVQQSYVPYPPQSQSASYSGGMPLQPQPSYTLPSSGGYSSVMVPQPQPSYTPPSPGGYASGMSPQPQQSYTPPLSVGYNTVMTSQSQVPYASPSSGVYESQPSAGYGSVGVMVPHPQPSYTPPSPVGYSSVMVIQPQPQYTPPSSGGYDSGGMSHQSQPPSEGYNTVMVPQPQPQYTPPSSGGYNSGGMSSQPQPSYTPPSGGYNTAPQPQPSYTPPSSGGYDSGGMSPQLQPSYIPPSGGYNTVIASQPQPLPLPRGYDQSYRGYNTNRQNGLQPQVQVYSYPVRYNQFREMRVPSPPYQLTGQTGVGPPLPYQPPVGQGPIQVYTQYTTAPIPIPPTFRSFNGQNGQVPLASFPVPHKANEGNQHSNGYENNIVTPMPPTQGQGSPPMTIPRNQK